MQDDPYRRVEAYAERIGAPTLNAALCALIAAGLDATEPKMPTPATPRQRGAR